MEPYIFNIGVSGLSDVGYLSGKRATLKLNSAIDDASWLAKTALHELGHIIGLYHEHQRYDRDTWVTVTKSGADYNIIPKDVSGWRIEWVRVRIGWWTISIPYLCLWEQRNSTVYGAFDFDSIMLYSDEDIVVKKIPVGNTTLKIGEPAPENYVLSPTDIATAKAIY